MIMRLTTSPSALPIWFLFLIALTTAACTTSHELSETERSLLLTECDFPGFELPNPLQPKGEFTRTEDYVNRSTELSYELLDENHGIYVSSTLSIERNPGNVLITELTSDSGLKIGFSTQGIKEKPVKLKRSYGKRASLALLMMNDQPVGNHFTVVSGKKVLTLIFTGVYFEEEEEFAAFIAPKLDLLYAHPDT